MRSLRRWRVLVCAGLVGFASGAVMPASITPAPRHVDAQRLWVRQQDPDAIDLLKVLVTALPQSLRQIAATNVPAVSSILWQEFLDNNRPDWFRELPVDIQRYLIDEFGPATAAPPDSSTVPTDVPASVTSEPTATSPGQVSSMATSTLETTSAAAESSASGPESSSSGATSTPLPSQTQSEPFPSASSLLPSASSLSSSALSLSPSASQTPVSSSTATASPSAPPSSTPTDPVAPASSHSGLTRNAKIGIGIGVPLGTLALAALIFSCCMFLRRRRKRHIEGSQPPSSPGFIPRFSFQVGGDADGYTERLNPSAQRYENGTREENWDDDDEEGYAVDTAYHGHAISPAATPAGMQDSHTPMLAPGLYHSHSSNRARGRQISCSSLQSVAEMREPDEERRSVVAESPVLGRYYHPADSRGARNEAVSRSIRRKPVPVVSGLGGYPGSGGDRDVGTRMGKRDGASQVPSRPALAFPHTATQHSGTGSSSSALASSSLSSWSSRAYVEDYGPEYHYAGGGYDDGYEQAHIGRGF